MAGNAVVVKLREKGTMFQDLTQNRAIVGPDPVVVIRTEQISQAIAGGALIVVEGEEAKAAIAKYKAEKGVDDEGNPVESKEAKADRLKKEKEDEEAAKKAAEDEKNKK